jgi:parallel beta-helix repeat protein
VGDAAALQTAVIMAGSNSQADTITLTAGCTYTLTSTLTVNADSGNTLTINGNGATISGNNARQVFYIGFGARVDLNQVTITGGKDVSFFGSGGIFNGGTLTISNSTISNSSASSGGGGIRNNNTLTITSSTLSGNSTSDDGGGIYNSGTLTIINSTLSGNSASDDGGGIYSHSGTITISNSTLSGNSASDMGGGIYNTSTITISNSIIANSTSGGDCVRLAGTINASYSLIESGLSGCVTPRSRQPISRAIRRWTDHCACRRSAWPSTGAATRSSRMASPQTGPAIRASSAGRWTWARMSPSSCPTSPLAAPLAWAMLPRCRPP